MSSVRALVGRTGTVRLEERTSRAPDAGEVVIGVEAAGLCRTDLAVADGRLGVDDVVLGHECSGRVLEVGDGVDRGWLGRRVAPWPFVGDEQLGVHRDGAFADRLTVGVGQLEAMPETLDPRVAAMFEPLVAALAVEQALEAVGRDVPVVLLGRNRVSALT